VVYFYNNTNELSQKFQISGFKQMNSLHMNILAFLN
jgi:hypothetical protein